MFISITIMSLSLWAETMELNSKITGNYEIIKGSSQCPNKLEVNYIENAIRNSFENYFCNGKPSISLFNLDSDSFLMDFPCIGLGKKNYSDDETCHKTIEVNSSKSIITKDLIVTKEYHEVCLDLWSKKTAEYELRFKKDGFLILKVFSKKESYECSYNKVLTGTSGNW